MRAGFAIVLAGVAAASIAHAAPVPAGLASHRAIYDISLARTEPGGVVAATGRTVIEFQDVCTGWTTTQRFVADMTNSEGDPSRTDFLSTSWESKDGQQMQFTLKNSVDGHMAQRFEGNALRASGGRGTVNLSVPHGKTFALPATAILPTEHTMGILRAAASGATGIHEIVFQGGDKSDLYDATGIIGRKATQGELAQDRANDTSGLLGKVGARSVLISYYAYGSRAEAPEYEVAYRLYDNGVVSSMSMIYSNFTLHAKLVKLERLAPHC